MQHNKIIKDERGTIRIQVDLWIDSYSRKDANGNSFRYDVFIGHIPPRKRTEQSNPRIATDTEIQQAKEEYWQLLKPTP